MARFKQYRGYLCRLKSVSIWIFSRNFVVTSSINNLKCVVQPLYVNIFHLLASRTRNENSFGNVDLIQVNKVFYPTCVL